jgi:hypothetical protein
VLALLAAGAVALGASSAAVAYDWPVAPFHRQHAIRGAFDDPRSLPGFAGGSFHFGVDIVAPDGTAVYAVAPGTVYRYPDAVAVQEPDGREFSYWHIAAVVPEHVTVRVGELLGFVRAGFGHVHFAEGDGEGYLNPLRPGALQPFVDDTTPVVGPIDVYQVGAEIDATAEAYDPPPLAPPPPWNGARWAPALVRWRLLRDGTDVIRWRTAADFRTSWLPPGKFRQIYAPGTVQNLPGRPGRYVFWLARGLFLSAGAYELQVTAADTRGNIGRDAEVFDVGTDQSLKTTNLSSR